MKQNKHTNHKAAIIIVTSRAAPCNAVMYLWTQQGIPTGVYTGSLVNAKFKQLLP